MSKRSDAFFRYLAYAMEIAVVYAVGNTPGLMPEIFGAKPALLVCVALTAAVFEREIPAMLIGMICGILIDLGYSDSVGVFTVALTAVCFVVGYAANNLIMATLLNFILYSLITVSGLFMLYFLFRFVWAGIDDRWVYFANHIVSRIVQTFLWSIGFYYLNRLVYELLGEEGS